MLRASCCPKLLPPSVNDEVCGVCAAAYVDGRKDVEAWMIGAAAAVVAAIGGEGAATGGDAERMCDGCGLRVRERERDRPWRRSLRRWGERPRGSRPRRSCARGGAARRPMVGPAKPGGGGRDRSAARLRQSCASSAEESATTLASSSVRRRKRLSRKCHGVRTHERAQPAIDVPSVSSTATARFPPPSDSAARRADDSTWSSFSARSSLAAARTDASSSPTALSTKLSTRSQGLSHD